MPDVSNGLQSIGSGKICVCVKRWGEGDGELAVSFAKTGVGLAGRLQGIACST